MLVGIPTDLFHTNLNVKWKIIAKTIACTKATVYLLPFGGNLRRTLGVKMKKRMAM